VPFRRAAAGVLVLAAAIVVFALTRGGEAPQAPQSTATPTATPTPTPTATPAPLDAPTAEPSLAVGLTEENPNLIADLGETATPEWARWRRRLDRMQPVVYRIVVEWNTVQPRAGAPANLALPSNGCMRDKGPCAAYAGVRDQLRALAARHAQGLVVFAGLPRWATRHVSGCDRGTSPDAGLPRPAALPAFRRLVDAVLAEARAQGAEVPYVSPWNEPNHPFSLAPQRVQCDPAAPSPVALAYTALARTVKAALAAAPGEQQLVLGETAGLLEPTARATAVPELIRALPRGLVCSARVWSQHAYIGGTDPVSAVAAALDARRCARRQAIWITETGVGPAPGGLSLARGITSERQGCRLLHQRLLAWYRDRRVTLAAQYTFREDDLFPTGLVTTDLQRARPALSEWQAWGDRPQPDSPPPHSTCD
jgi:hypothetical protein